MICPTCGAWCDLLTAANGDLAICPCCFRMHQWPYEQFGYALGDTEDFDGYGLA